MGSLPVALSLHRKGASSGAVIAFLIATPATSLSALLVSWRLLGIDFTLYIFFAVIAMGLILGMLGNLFNFKPKKDKEEDSCGCHDDSCELEHEDCEDGHCEHESIDTICGMKVENPENAPKSEFEGKPYYFCCGDCKNKFDSNPAKYAQSGKPTFWSKFVKALKYSFIDMPKDIGFELLIGLILAAVVASVDPIGNFISQYLTGALSYIVSLVFGILMYFCSTASVPLVSALIGKGLASGAGMVLLIAGPVTSWGTILVLRKQWGGKMLTFYLIGISVLSLLAGIIYSFIV
jgi:hypothetical protein